MNVFIQGKFLFAAACPDPAGEVPLAIPAEGMEFADYHLLPRQCRAVMTHLILDSQRKNKTVNFFIGSSTREYLEQLMHQAARKDSGWTVSDLESASSLIEAALESCQVLPPDHRYCPVLREHFIARRHNTDPINNDWDNPDFDDVPEIISGNKDIKVWVEEEDHLPPHDIRFMSEVQAFEKRGESDILLCADQVVPQCYVMFLQDLNISCIPGLDVWRCREIGEFVDNGTGQAPHQAVDLLYYDFLTSITDPESGERKDVTLEELFRRLSTKTIYRNDFS